LVLVPHRVNVLEQVRIPSRTIPRRASEIVLTSLEIALENQEEK
jgi:hypothetical protein